jgi:electron transport complex protein RnfE
VAVVNKAKKTSPIKTLTNGILKENPTLRLVLGTCPTLAVTTSALFGLGMGVSVTAVLIGSNIVISLFRKVIPDKVRIPAFITIIAGFVTIVQLLLEAYVPALNESLGIFIPLIVVNCIILARAEMFASKNNVFLSSLDAIGMGVGFTLALLLIGSIREIFGNGTWFGIRIAESFENPAVILILPPGGFFVFGIVIAIVNKLSKKKIDKSNCESCGMCKMASGESGKMAVAGCGQADISGGVDKSNKDIDISNKGKVNINVVDATLANSHALGTNIENIGVENKGEDNQ